MSADTGAREPQELADELRRYATFPALRAFAGMPQTMREAADALAAGVGVPPDRRRIETTQFRIGNAHIELPGEHVAFADRVIRMHAALEAIASISEDAIVDDDGRSPLSRIYALADEGLYGSVDT